MSWIKTNPPMRSENHKEKNDNVRISFSPLNKNFRMIITIPTMLFECIKIKHLDFVSISYDSQNSRILLIKKSDKGYRVSQITKKYFTMQFTWDVFTPNDDEFKTFNIKHEFYEDGLKLFVYKQGVDENI